MPGCAHAIRGVRCGGDRRRGRRAAAQHGHEVVLIARGAHLDAIRADGLRIERARRGHGDARRPVGASRANRLPRRRRRVARDEGPGHRGRLRVLAAAVPPTRGRVRAERRRQRADALRLLRERLRRVRHVPRGAPRAGVVVANAAPVDRHPRHRPVPARRRRARGGDRRRVRRRRRSTRCRGPTSCGGSTASS